MPMVELTHIIVPAEVHREPEDLQGRIQAIIYRFEGGLCTDELLGDLFREINNALCGYEADYTVTLNLTGNMQARISHKTKGMHKYSYVLERNMRGPVNIGGANSADDLDELFRKLMWDIKEATKARATNTLGFF